MIGGKTPSEQYLGRLCQRSFLSLWSYPNVFSNDGIVDGKGIGKELCDLLVVFGDDVIIFSDKSCEYKNTGKLAVDWNRWYRKSIEKSAKQLYGAERWLRNFPNRLYLDPSCTKPFPIDLPPPERIRVHRIAVALGAKDECKAFYGGGSGSLRISTDLEPTMVNDDDRLKAFCIGHFDPSKGYVHVFDDVTLDIVMQELDTVSDFCGYLRKKEELIAKATIISAGEEESLAHYLTTMDDDGTHGFGNAVLGCTGVFIPEGHWSGLRSHPQYIAKKRADQESYIWDRLIEHFNRSLQSGDSPEDVELRDYERGVRRMASLSRVERRMVGKKLREVLETTPENGVRYAGALMGRNRDLAFAFVLLSPLEDRSYEEYREVRTELLAAFCNVLKLRNPSIREVVGLAMEPHKPGRGGSEVLAFFDFSTWTDEQQKQAEGDQQLLGIQAQPVDMVEQEYPDQRSVKAPTRETLRRLAQLERQQRKRKGQRN